MIFIYEGKRYPGRTAVEIVRRIELDSTGYPGGGGIIAEFLRWALARLADVIPARELDVSPSLPDETIAFNYLCLLDHYDLGTFYDTRSKAEIGEY